MKDLAVQIIENSRVSRSFFLLKFKYPLKLKPGQFFNIRINNSVDPYLRRPLSVHDWDAQTHTVSLLYKVVGRGTKLLAALKKGSEFKVLGPLGNSFELKGLRGKDAVALIGGGIGLAPLVFLAKELAKRKIKVHVFAGFKNKAEVYVAPAVKKISKELFISTDDGSLGKQGFITAYFAEKLSKQRYAAAFVCGPENMMKITSAICKKADVPVQYSLESIMGCGIGACMCCVCDTVMGYKKVCADGPVFKDEELVW